MNGPQTISKLAIPRTAMVGVLAAVLLSPLVAHAAGRVGTSGTIYVDYWHLTDEQARNESDRSMTGDISLKMDVDVREDLSVSIKACYACHGLELGHAQFDYTPKGWFNLAGGRIAVPFGQFASRYDQSGHVSTSNPLIYDMGRMIHLDAFGHGVLPMPYVDVGGMVYGQVWPSSRLQVGYSAYVVAGMKGVDEIDYGLMHEPEYRDNNRWPAGGGRLTLTLTQDASSFLGDASVGASYTAGRWDPAARLGYWLWGVDAAFRVGPFTVRGEYATRRTYLPGEFSDGAAAEGAYYDKYGYYVEVEHPIGQYVRAVYRIDELWRKGALTPDAAEGGLSTDSHIARYTVGAEVRPIDGLFFKASFEHWRPSDFNVTNGVHVGMGATF